MRRAGIQTGQLIGKGLVEPTRNVGATLTNVIYGPASTDVRSRIFCVGNGEKKLLSAYGLQGTDFIKIFKVVTKIPKLPSVSDSCGCDVDTPEPPTVLYSKEYGECTEVIGMHCAQDELALPGPACYQLELGEGSMLGRIYLEMQNLDA